MLEKSYSEESAKIIFNDLSAGNLNRSSNFRVDITWLQNDTHCWMSIKCHIWLETFSDFPDLVILLFFYIIVLLY